MTLFHVKSCTSLAGHSPICQECAANTHRAQHRGWNGQRKAWPCTHQQWWDRHCTAWHGWQAAWDLPRAASTVSGHLAESTTSSLLGNDLRLPIYNPGVPARGMPWESWVNFHCKQLDSISSYNLKLLLKQALCRCTHQIHQEYINQDDDVRVFRHPNCSNRWSRIWILN